nr:hypothetical protein [Flavobacterium sp. LS1P28]
MCKIFDPHIDKEKKSLSTNGKDIIQLLKIDLIQILIDEGEQFRAFYDDLSG